MTTYGKTTEQLPQWLSDYTQGVIGKANSIASMPYQAYTGPRIAGFAPDQQKAMDNVRSNVGSWQPAMNQAANLIPGATGAEAVAGSSPLFSSATDLYKQSMDPQFSTLKAASPFLQQAGQSFPDQASRYVDPYVGNVIDRSTQLAMRNFNEKVMPGINDQFIKDGQYGSSAHLREANRGARDLTEGVQSQAQGALSQAYQQAQSAFGADASRMSGLAGLAGQLTESDRQSLTNAGQGLANIGTASGNLGIQQANTQRQAAEAGSNIATAAQTAATRDTSSLAASGDTQQQQAQRNLDLANQDFRDQTQYPRDQLDWLSSVVRGIPYNKTTSTTNNAPLPGAQYGASPLAQVGSLIDIFNGIRGSGKAEGGPVRMAEGGPLSMLSQRDDKEELLRLLLAALNDGGEDGQDSDQMYAKGGKVRRLKQLFDSHLREGDIQEARRVGARMEELEPGSWDMAWQEFGQSKTPMQVTPPPIYKARGGALSCLME